MKKLFIGNRLSIVLYLKIKLTAHQTHEEMQLNFYDHKPDGFSPEDDWVIPPLKQLIIPMDGLTEFNCTWHGHEVSARSSEADEGWWISFDEFVQGKN